MRRPYREGPGSHGVMRVNLNGLVEVFNGAVGLALIKVGDAPTIEGKGVIRIAPDGLIVTLDGAVVLLLAKVGKAAVEEGFGMISRRLPSRLDHRRAAADLVGGGAGGEASLLINGLSVRWGAEADDVRQHE